MMCVVQAEKELPTCIVFSGLLGIKDQNDAATACMGFTQMKTVELSELNTP